jgi:hypothetical protein
MKNPYPASAGSLVGAISPGGRLWRAPSLASLAVYPAGLASQSGDIKLTWYDDAGYNSFNVALFSGALSGDDGFRVSLCMVTRSAVVPFCRSDAMYMERLHWEAAVDRTPEENAEAVRACGFP